MENSSNFSEETILQINYPDELSQIYSEESLANQEKRYEDLIENFEKDYEIQPNFFARAPGRVNLIGEHIDYEGFAVLPMAVENDIVIAGSSKEENHLSEKIDHCFISFKHLQGEKFKTYNFNEAKSKQLNFVSPHDWVNYVIAGYNAMLNYMKEKNIQPLVGSDLKINFLFTGNIPTASGLSSSSALTVCSAMAFVKALGLEDKITKNELARATINYERSVGTACGGMDQTISVYAEKNKAKLIEFNPDLRAKTVNLPTNVSFVIANSLTDSPKFSTLAYRYNKRVVENKLALAIISKKLNLEKIHATLFDLKNYLKVDFDKLLDVIKNTLPSGERTLDEIKTLLRENVKNNNLNSLDNQYSVENILKNIPHYDLVLKSNNTFKLQERLTHVCEEAERVLSFYEICQKAESESEESINELGKLMNLSHTSCKELYECSSPELNSLVEFAIENKAKGARLTGAGWGGCSVFMITNENMEYLMNKLEEFYKNKGLKKIGDEEHFFKTKACQGACILKVKIK